MNEPSTLTTTSGGARPGATSDPERATPWSGDGPPPPSDVGATRRSGRMTMGLQAALNREWGESNRRAKLSAQRSRRRDERLARFGFAGEALAEMDAAARDTEHSCRDSSTDRAGEVARALAEAAAAGDVLAARLLLQHVLPGLSALAWGSWLRGVHRGERRDVFDSMVSTVWLSLVSGEALRGNLEIRKRLFHDAEYWVLQRPRRRQTRENRVMGTARGGERVADIAGRLESDGIPAGEELLEVVCEALVHGLALKDAQVMADLGTASSARYGVWAVTEASKVDPDGVTTRGIRYRRAAALRRVRVLAAQAA
ncbi:MAG: hypothetical protein M3083_09195 [Actinomycetota bacterium]|nr:hypothetical protein [Actinomycetota bacterium]